MSNEKPSTSNETIKKKSDALLAKINGIITKDHNEIGRYESRFNRAIDQALLDISMLKPGRKLFKRLLKSPFPITIRMTEFDRQMSIAYVSNFDWKTCKMNTERAFINLPIDYLDNETFCMQDGYPAVLGLVHELIHVMHYIAGDSGWEMRIRSSMKSNLLSPEFDDLEEQLTICGIGEKRDTIDLCENAFARAFGYNFREHHHGHPKKIETA
ncbi:MAG: hypothetical protein ACHQUC_06855 [Chlamydiales bacterium]